MSIRRAAGRFATILFASTLAACNGAGDLIGPEPWQPGQPTDGRQFHGIYRLVSINGNALSTPYVQHHLGNGTFGKQFVTDGRLELRSDGTYTLFLNKALQIGNGPLVMGPLNRTGSWTYQPGQAGDMSGPIRLDYTGGHDLVDATPYTVTDLRHLDPFSDGSERLVYSKE